MLFMGNMITNLMKKDEFIFGARETWTTGGYKDQNYDNFSMSGQYLHKLTEMILCMLVLDNHL